MHIRFATWATRPTWVTSPQRPQVTSPGPEPQRWWVSRAQMGAGKGMPAPSGEHAEYASAPHCDGLPLALAQREQ